MLFSSPKRSVRNYISFEIPKKSGGYRHISAPVRGLKEIQKCLNYLLELMYYPKDNVTGFVRGKSIVDNASPHIGKNYIFNVDLQDFSKHRSSKSMEKATITTFMSD